MKQEERTQPFFSISMTDQGPMTPCLWPWFPSAPTDHWWRVTMVAEIRPLGAPNYITGHGPFRARFKLNYHRRKKRDQLW